MSAPQHHRGRPASIAALGVVGLALLGIAVLLSPGGAWGTVRTVVGCLAVLAIPAWLVGRLVDEDGDAIGRAVGGMVATLAVCALSGFVAFELHLRVATAVFAVPLLVLVAAAALLGSTAPRVRRAPFAPLLVAVVLGAVALLGAMGAHLVLPAAPVEPAFSIEAATATASRTGVTVTVTVARVHTEEPTQLQLFIGSSSPSASSVQTFPVAETKLIPSDVTSTTLTAPLPRGVAACSVFVRLEAPNGAFLTPPVTCVGP